MLIFLFVFVHVFFYSSCSNHLIPILKADEALALGELQQVEGFRFDAMLNYHTACVYYRVMECMIPALTSHVHQRLQYAAWRARQCSSLSHNFVLEHFDGESCSEVYEVHGSNKLGKGSYGSVYLATHRLTGDERAVKVMNVDRVTSYYLRKLHTEISILKCVDHPNIIKLQDVFFGKRSVYLVTDLCRGTFTYICTYTYVILLFFSYFPTLLLFHTSTFLQCPHTLHIKIAQDNSFNRFLSKQAIKSSLHIFFKF